MIFIESGSNLCGTCDWDNTLVPEVKGLMNESLSAYTIRGDDTKIHGTEEINTQRFKSVVLVLPCS
jgi:hypothetical protein